jgi:hypothetical protein
MHWTSRKLLVVLLVSFPTALAARAGEIEMKAPVADSTIYTPTPLAEIFTGFAAAPGGYYGDFGTVFALRGDLDGDGLLIRLRGSGGSYSYDRTPTVRQSALYETGELMIGYRALIGSASLTGYIGPEIQHYANDDPGALVAGTKLGLKGEMQLYAPFAKQWYFFALGSFSSAWSSYFAMADVGYLINGVSIGPEAAALGNATFDALRAGGFVGFDTPLGEVTVGAGYQWGQQSSNTILRTRDDGIYGTLRLRSRF